MTLTSQTLSYTQCQSGERELDQTVCQPCAAGRFSQGVAQRACSVCEAGSYAPTARSTRCLLCAAGNFSQDAEQSSCLSCAPGSSLSLDAVPVCSLSGSLCCVQARLLVFPVARCDSLSLLIRLRLFASTLPIPQVCASCDVGTYSTQFGAQSCSPCAAGTFADQPRSSLCKVRQAHPGLLC